MATLEPDLEGSGSSDDEGGDACPDNDSRRRGRRPILDQLAHVDSQPLSTPNHLGGLSRRWASRSYDVVRGNTPVTRNNSSNAARVDDDNRRLPTRNRSASPSRVHADRHAAPRSRSNSQVTAVVSNASPIAMHGEDETGS